MVLAHCAGCHRSFSGVTLFDAHRSATGDRGRCLDPAVLTHAKTGEPMMIERDGVWSGPEMTDEQKIQRFGSTRDVNA